MTAPGSHNRQSPAFTLLEVMLAVVVAAFVLVAVNAVFFGALRLRSRTIAAFDIAHSLERALAVIQRDLANLTPAGGTLATSLPTNSSTVSITTLQPGQVSPYLHTATAVLDDLTPWGEVQKVAYLLVESTNRNASGRDLVRSVSRNLFPPSLDQPELERLLSGVEDIAFLYYDGTQWRPDWDAPTEATPLPRAIKVELQLAAADRGYGLPPPIELVVPLLVDGGTNQTEQTTGGTP